MTGLLITAWVALAAAWFVQKADGHPVLVLVLLGIGLALIAVALYLAWRAGGAA